MARLDDYRLMLRGRSYVPLLIGGMGVDISTEALALEAARLGGIGHLSDALAAAVTDRYQGTDFLRRKQARCQGQGAPDSMAAVGFDLAELREATERMVGRAMHAKRGPGGVFLNVMEKLTMGAPRETLRVRLAAAMNAGIDGITLSAGLHLGSLGLVADHPRFREVAFGIVVSSARALALFLARARRVDRLPDYVIVEGPLAGGHLGFGVDEWRQADLGTQFHEVRDLVRREGLELPVIPAGGIFTGGDAVAFMQQGAAAVQVATRFTITRECGLPEHAKQVYLRAGEADIVVSEVSPTGYPMRLLRQSPALGSNLRPGCETYGYLLDGEGGCAYLRAYQETPVDPFNGRKAPVQDKVCLCTHMHAHRVYTCGATASRLKETTVLEASGRYHLPSAEHVFRDYQFSEGDRISLPLVPLQGTRVPLRLVAAPR